MGEMMKLIDAIRDINALDEESTIYAAEPWGADSEVIVAREPESRGLPSHAQQLGLKYFLEVFIARDFLADWLTTLVEPPTLLQKCERLVTYARTDA